MELWFTERSSPNFGLFFRIKESLLRERTAYQDLVVLDTHDFGRMMVLDGAIMFTERDEFVYHEMIVHVPLFTHPAPRDVLIIGGGDGGAIREVCRHPEVQTVTLCEIDPRVIEVARSHFPTLTTSLDDPRVKIQVADGIRFIQDSTAAFDVILIDSTDPVGPAVGLFQEDFYRECQSALRPGGVLAGQCESPFGGADGMRQMHLNLNNVFPVVQMYLAHIPTYPSGTWSFGLASTGPHPVRDLDPERVARAGLDLSYYTAEVHRGAFALPPFVTRLLES